MRKIPEELRNEMASDPFYKSCCVGGDESCAGKIEWHHNLIFQGRQVNEKFCILPVCKRHHDNIVYVKGLCDWIMWNRATEEQIQYYSKAVDYKWERDRLNEHYGKYNQ